MVLKREEVIFVNGKQLVMATLISAILLTIAFTPISTEQSVRDYDPWYDINDDGKIDIRDVAGVAIKFGSEGIPINKTALLETLKNQSRWLPTPAYDSGWISIEPTQFLTFSHNLGTPEVFVYLLGKNESGAIHQLTHEMNGVQIVNLDNLNITIWRHGLDRFWYQVRVMIWKIGEPTQSKTWHYVTSFTLSSDNHVSPLFFIQGEKWRIKWEPTVVGVWYALMIFDENGYVIDNLDLTQVVYRHPDAKGIYYVYQGEGDYYIEAPIQNANINFTIESYH